MNNKTYSIASDKKINALMFSVIIYLCLLIFGKYITMLWQPATWTIDKIIIWFCSVIPAACVSIALYFICVKNEFDGASILALIFAYAMMYATVFGFIFLLFIIVSIFEAIGFGAILLLLLLFGGADVLLVIIII